MSKMSELAYDIEQLYIEGKSARQIAAELNCPMGVVKGWIEGNNVSECEEELDPYNTVNS